MPFLENRDGANFNISCEIKFGPNPGPRQRPVRWDLLYRSLKKCYTVYFSPSEIYTKRYTPSLNTTFPYSFLIAWKILPTILCKWNVFALTVFY